MTIAVLWEENDFLWCASDTRLVHGIKNKIVTETAAKIYAIPLSISAMNPDEAPTIVRQPHYWTQYGFVYAGSALPASQTAITASTLLQNLLRPGERSNPPFFEDIAQLIKRLAESFMREKRQFGGDGLFQAAFFGWCPFCNCHKVAFIDGRDDAGSLRVELSYPPPPESDGDPWLVLGSGASSFRKALSEYRDTEPNIKTRIPRRVIDKLVKDGNDETVGGATSLGAAYRDGFQIFYTVEPIVHGQPAARRLFNGLDLDIDIGSIGQYIIGANGIA